MNFHQVLPVVFSDSLECALAECVLEQTPERADVILLWTGYGTRLCDRAAKLWRDGLAPRIDIFGCNSYSWKQNPGADAECYAHYLAAEDVPKSIVYADAENDGLGTKSQALKSVARMKENGWKSALLVTAGYHQVRAYMTLLKELQGDARVVPAPHMVDDWVRKDKVLQDSWVGALGRDELPRLRKYQESQDVASWDELGSYLARQGFAKAAKIEK